MDVVAAEFGEGKSLYDILDIPPTATAGVIKKAYFKLALKCHPDKCPGDDAAKGRFQALSLIHSVLSDPERRSLYDETGDIAEEGQDDGAEGEELWSHYWRTLFPKITVADIESFGNKYQGSDEEKRDVLGAYKKHKGKMAAVMDSTMLASAADEDRFRAMIDAAIESKEVSAFAAYRKGAKASVGSKQFAKKRQAKIDKEAAEAQELMAMIKGRNTDKEAGSLSTRRGKEFNNLVRRSKGWLAFEVRRSKGWLAFEVNHVSQGSAAVVVFA
ncbi:unnamed protein product [Ectocarpus fasciculatus]